jgi:hypothetical protein
MRLVAFLNARPIQTVRATMIASLVPVTPVLEVAYMPQFLAVEMVFAALERRTVQIVK